MTNRAFHESSIALAREIGVDLPDYPAGGFTDYWGDPWWYNGQGFDFSPLLQSKIDAADVIEFSGEAASGTYYCHAFVEVAKDLALVGNGVTLVVRPGFLIHRIGTPRIVVDGVRISCTWPDRWFPKARERAEPYGLFFGPEERAAHEFRRLFEYRKDGSTDTYWRDGKISDGERTDA